MVERKVLEKAKIEGYYHGCLCINKKKSCKYRFINQCGSGDDRRFCINELEKILDKNHSKKG